MKNYKEFKKELLKDLKIKKEYDRLEPEFKLTETLIRKRLKKGLTQKELALKIGTKQSAISRLESGYQNPTLQLLQKVSKALDANLKISIQ
jgi:predicted transcriptional regulator